MVWGILAIYSIGMILLLRMGGFQSLIARTLDTPGARVAAKLCFGIIWTALALAMLGLAMGVGLLERIPIFLFPASLIPVFLQGEMARRRTHR